MSRGKRQNKGCSLPSGTISDASDRSRPIGDYALDPRLSIQNQVYISAYRQLQGLLEPLVSTGGCTVIVGVDRGEVHPWLLQPTDIQIELLEEITEILEGRLGAQVTIFAYGKAPDSDHSDPIFASIKERGGKFLSDSLKQVVGDKTHFAAQAIKHGRDLAANSPARHSVLLILPDGASADAVETRVEYMRARKDGVNVAAIGQNSSALFKTRWLQEEFDNSWVNCAETEEFLPVVAAACQKALVVEPEV